VGKLVPVVAAFLAGMAVAAQGPINSELARYVGRYRAVFISVMVSITTMVVVLLLRGELGSFGGAAQAPRWALLGGFLGVVSLFGMIIAVPRIGVAATTGAILAAQVIVSALIDQFGLLGVASRPMTAGRLAGLALLVVAVALVTRG
jgi:transporter family-2 protein